MDSKGKKISLYGGERKANEPWDNEGCSFGKPEHLEAVKAWLENTQHKKR